MEKTSIKSLGVSHLPSSGEVVLSLVNNFLLKHITGLLSGTLLHVLIVDLHKWNISLVARDNGCLLSNGTLQNQKFVMINL